MTQHQTRQAAEFALASSFTESLGRLEANVMFYGCIETRNPLVKAESDKQEKGGWQEVRESRNHFLGFNRK